ncbi:hypothetical protein ANAPH2_01196 [Anaplasma phagocytophilum]|nr:hypothetical protein ANAPH2_01196 [Anaplasma phagocytophilum]
MSLYNNDRIMVFIPTDFPEPVVPAINRWGIFVKSPTTGSPSIPLPKMIGNFRSRSKYSLLSIRSRSTTIFLLRFGNSMPITFLPGTTEILVDSALIDRAISSDKPIIREDFVPAEGSNSYRVTTGP